MPTPMYHKKILIVAPSWVGDMVMAESLLQILRQGHPQVLLDILAPNYLEPLLRRIPCINKIWISPFSHGELNLSRRYSLAKMLRSQHYDQAIILPNSWKSALVPFFANVAQRTCWRGEMRYFLSNDIRVLNKEDLPMMVQRFVALGVAKNAPLPRIIPNPQLYTNATFITQTLQELNLPQQPPQPLLALCVGAEYGPAKRWPADYFAKVAAAKAKVGWAIWLFGGAKDKEIAAHVQQASGNVCLNLTGKTSLAQAVDLLSLASAVITNDSGLMHVAAALNLPLVALYGSSSPEFTPPLTNKARILSLHLPCSPCFKRQCPLGHFKCMLELKPEVVLQCLTELSG